jgi:ABC-2 type transport system ATP-binding protein
MTPIVVVRDLVKSYGSAQAVRGVSLSIKTGEIFGLLGPNGAGKTTTLECIIGLRQPDSGHIEVCGYNALAQSKEVKQRIGVQLQATALQDKIRVREALALFASFYKKHADPDSLLERFSLVDKARSRFETLSSGQKQRLAIALALINEPEVLLLDEPTAGLDPQSRRELHGVVRQMREEGRTVLLTTHYIEEAEQLCDRIAIIDQGKIIATGTPAELVAGARSLPRIAFSAARPMDLSRVKSLASVQHANADGERWIIGTTNVSQTVVDLVGLLQAENNELRDLQIRRPTLEDVFIELTGHGIRD